MLLHKFLMPITGSDVGEEPEDHKAQLFLGESSHLAQSLFSG